MRKEWSIRKLGDICTFENGDRGKNYPSRSVFTTAGVPFINAGHLSANGLAVTELDYIPRNRYDLLSNGKIRKGDVLFCLRGSLGKFAPVNEIVEGAIASSLVIIRTTNAISNDFLLYYLESSLCKAMIAKYSNGAAQPNLSARNLAQFEIPLPPLAEQQHIVAILDDAFAGLEIATANAEKNLKNARELFESYLNSVFESAADWSQSPIGKLATKIGSGATPTGGEKSYKKQGVPLIRSLNVHDRRFKIDDLAFLDDTQAKKLDGVTVQSGDVLLNITGASVARCCLAPDQFLPARVNQHVSIIRPIQSAILPPFLEFGLTAKVNKDRLLGVGESGGATRQAITKAQIQAFVFSYPSLATQQTIIEKLDSLGAGTGKLESGYADKIKALAGLKQSILQKAFSGELSSSPSRALNEAAE
ncbi:restriction endonuclease subunit S [Bradyrhizobium ottawaense]|uniref:restriction endonuclease subunit S n=1 Tax=Bradyrhizobium ottawaense TaxID=931866 RepID=UPI001BADB15E|nr:restriction endonuclease subunit S [Bradyrhizobium ottawaense]MBR1290133.1 restriction endonuclease subunit S [Bradyrhizobium ottawaense]